jgi:hypothetical protein
MFEKIKLGFIIEDNMYALKSIEEREAKNGKAIGFLILDESKLEMYIEFINPPKTLPNKIPLLFEILKIK